MTSDAAPNAMSPDAGTTDAPSTSGGCVSAGASHGLATLYTGNDQIIAMRLAHGLLYFSDPTGVWSLPLAGGTASPVATGPSGGGDLVGPFAITTTNVVWADKSTAAFQPTLHAEPLAGGAVVDLAGPAELTPLGGLEATDTTAYPLVLEAPSLYAVPLDGGAATTLATNTDLSGLLVVGSNLYFSNSFSGQPANELLRVALPAGTPESLVGIGSGAPMSSDAQNLYLGANLNQQDSLESWPLAGGAVATLDTFPADTYSGQGIVFANAGGRIYFGQPDPCGDAATHTYAVWEIGADKSGLQVDVSGLDIPTAMAADASYVYVATTQGGFGSSHIQRFAR
jgi:hypothetical protein